MPWKATNAMNQRTEAVLKALQTDNLRALCQECGISPKTGYKWKERFVREGLAGMVEHRQLRSRQVAGRLFSERKAKAPNEVWTVDFKGWWYGAEGRRCEPLTVRDEFSRYVLEVRAVANAQTQTVRECFEKLFRQHGLPGAIRSDNGTPFASMNGILGLSRLSAWWLVLGIDLERGRPACPQDNGGHERLHLDVERELSGERPAEQQAAFDEWRQTFNRERPHEALEMKRPAEVYRPSERKYEGTPEDLTYAKMGARRVHGRGYISIQKQRVFLSSALCGWSVGVEPVHGGQINVWFGRLLLGQLDERTFGFTRAQSTSQKSAPAPPQPAPLRSADCGGAGKDQSQ